MLLVRRRRRSAIAADEQTAFTSVSESRAWPGAEGSGASAPHAFAAVLPVLRTLRGGGALLCASAEGGDGYTADEDTGIIGNHLYTILDVQLDVAGSGIDLIMLRNPWGKTEWKGAWADESKEWAEHPDVDKVVKASEAVKSNEVKRGKNDGIFWMAASDFAKIFSFIDCVLFDAGSRKLQAMQEQAVGLAPTALALEGCVKPPPNPVSTRRASTASAALETNLPKAASCLGRYKKLARQINGRPAWYNVDVPDRFLTFSGNAWNVQRKEKLGWPVGCVRACPSTCLLSFGRRLDRTVLTTARCSCAQLPLAG
jgi:hypothetical protein